MIVQRRGLLAAMGALFCAPAIVHASSLMPVKALPEVWQFGGAQFDGVGQDLLMHGRAFLPVGSVVRIRLPNNYQIVERYNALIRKAGAELVRLIPEIYDTQQLPQLPVAGAVALGAAAVLSKNPEVSRRSLFGGSVR